MLAVNTTGPDILEPHSRRDDGRLGSAPRNGVSLFFPAGQRPSAQAIAGLLAAEPGTGSGGDVTARISHRPPDRDGWVELLANGLTFDLVGLAPALPAPQTEIVQEHGFDGACCLEGLETVELVPGGHIVGGARLLPVIRVLAGLAASLALKLPVAAVGWQSAQTVMEPRYFAQVVVNWLAGGAFPTLGLTALLRAEDGSIASRGLARFSGQEMQLEAAAGETPSDSLKLAIRVVDFLVRQGKLAAPREIDSPRGRLLAEPSQTGRQVWVWRQN